MKIVIVGGGITGLSTAFNLAKMGVRDIIIVEKSYINSGSSTRNASHFRVHFWSKENSQFALESRKILLNLSKETGWNPIFDVSGYLWLLSSEELLKSFKKSNEMWRSLGVEGQILPIEDVKKMYPYINVDDYVAAFFGPQDGKIHHDHVSYGYYRACVKKGVKFLEYTKVKKILAEGSRVKGVETDKGKINADTVVVAAGVWSKSILNTINIDIPTTPERKEIGVTDPLKHFLKPLIIDTKTSAYITQTVRGELIGSIAKPIEEGLLPLRNTLTWTKHWIKSITKVIPSLKYVRILRMWSGYYNVTPDHSHILGRDPEWPEGLYVNTGYSGHGFMMAPLGGKLLAEYIVTGEIPELMKPFSPTRFKEGKLVHETIVIG